MGQDQNEFPIQRVERLNWIVAVILGAVAGLTLSPFMSMSVFAGGFLANISFMLLKRDLKRFLQGQLIQSGKIEQAKRRFYLNYYIRLSALALIVFFLISRHVVQPLAFLVGMSAIVLSIVITMLTVVKKFYFPAVDCPHQG